VHTVESYAQTGAAERVAYVLGGTFASFSALPWAQRVAGAQIASVLPEGPSEAQLRDEWHVVVVEIEDVYRQTLIDWRWRTPNVYRVTAQLAVAIARAVAEGEVSGWLTPAEALAKSPQEREFATRDCRLARRIG
jgi:hypothetical protein